MKVLLSLATVASLTWTGLWWTEDQQGQRLMKEEKFVEAAEAFRDPMRKGVALFRAGEFEKAEQAFARVGTAEGEFNRGNSLLMQGKYEAAIGRYDRALELKPGWEDVKVNRSIAEARAKMTKNEGGDMGDQQIGADKIVFDKKKGSGGQDTKLDGDKESSDMAMQSLWLRKVQTKPAEFLKSKFLYQLEVGEEEAE